jgi:hypothetical protein
MRLGLAVVLAIATITGCGSADGLSVDTDDFIDVNTPPSNCSGTTGNPCLDPDSSGSPEGGPCANSDHCSPGTWCTAPFDGDHAGEFTCTAQCIELNDQAQWCLDSGVCCNPEAECSSRGLCLVPEPGADSGTGTDTGTDPTASSSGTGDTEGTSTSGGSSSGTGDATTTTTTTGMQ